jgi:hypothetical protein
VVQSLLRFEEAARLLGHDPRLGVTGLVEVDVTEAGLLRVPFQVLDERP